MKLAGKILSLLLFVTLGVFTFYAFLEIRRTEASLHAEANKLHIALFSNATKTMARAVWDVDKAMSKTILNQFLDNDSVTRVAIFDDSGSLFDGLDRNRDKRDMPSAKDLGEYAGIKWDGKPLADFSQDPNKMVLPIKELSANISRVSGSLWHEAEGKGAPTHLGSFVMEFSTEYISKTVREMQMRVVMWSLGLSVIILLAIFTYLRSQVIAPIGKLEQASLEIAKGFFTKAPHRSGRDEIASLTKQFNNMVNTLEQNVEGLKQIAEEGRKISCCMSFPSLVTQVNESVRVVASKKIGVRLFIRGEFIGHAMKEPYFSFLEDGTVDEERAITDIHKDVNGYTRYHINHVRTNATIGLMYVEKSSDTEFEKRLYSTLNALVVNIASSIENIRFLFDQKEQQRMQAELETTRLVQQSLMPKDQNPKVGFFEIAAYFKPAAECGGDWWNYFPLADGRLLILLGDVTGHGTPSALLTAVVKGYCDSIYWKTNLRASDILRELDIIVRSSSDGSKYMTMFAAVIDPVTQEMTFSSAAHNPPFLLRQGEGGGANISRLQMVGKRLGYGNNEDTHDQKSFQEKSTTFRPGDTLFIYSDGLVEHKNAKGREFSDLKLKKVLEANIEKDVGDIRHAALQSVLDFAQGYPADDDITLVVCRFHKETQESLENSPLMWQYINHRRAMEGKPPLQKVAS